MSIEKQMNKELEDLLLLELGELIYKQENTFDWIEKEAILRKINACYELLDIDKKEESFFEKVHKIIYK